MQFEHEGNQSNYVKKGEDGHLIIRFSVETDNNKRREGANIISRHYVTLSEALLGCNLTINTVKGVETIHMKPFTESTARHILPSKGINE